MFFIRSTKLYINPNMFNILRLQFSSKPTSSEVLTAYLLQCKEPPWTSYFVKYSSVKDDQFGMSNFNWKVGSSNYQILRTGCFPYIKYHCSKKRKEDLGTSDKFMRAIKVVNLGIPCLLYGLAATQLIKHTEIVHTTKGPVTIYFLLPEHKGYNMNRVKRWKHGKGMSYTEAWLKPKVHLSHVLISDLRNKIR